MLFRQDQLNPETRFDDFGLHIYLRLNPNQHLRMLKKKINVTRNSQTPKNQDLSTITPKMKSLLTSTNCGLE